MYTAFYKESLLLCVAMIWKLVFVSERAVSACAEWHWDIGTEIIATK